MTNLAPRPPASRIVLVLCILLLPRSRRPSARPRPSLLVAGYSTTSLRKMPRGRGCNAVCRRRPVLRMQLGGGMGGGTNGFQNNGQSNSFGAMGGGMGQGSGIMGQGNSMMSQGNNNMMGQGNSMMGQGNSNMMGQGNSNMMGQGNSMMGQGNNNMMGQGHGNNYMQGSSRGNNYYNYDQSNPRRPVESRYNQPSGSSVSDADFKNNGHQNGYQNAYSSGWQTGPNSETFGSGMTSRPRATLRDAGRNRSPTSNLGFICEQYLQRSTREIDRYAYDDYANAPSMPDEREWSRQQQHEQSNSYYGGTSDYSRGFSSEVGYGRGDQGGSYGDWGFRSASLSGLSRELRDRELEDIQESRRMGGPRRYRDGVYYDDGYERRRYGGMRPGRGARRGDDFDGGYVNDGGGEFSGGYSSGGGDRYFEDSGDGFSNGYSSGGGDQYNEENEWY